MNKKLRNSSGYGTIELKKQPHASGGIAVVYALNGIGKSSLKEIILIWQNLFHICKIMKINSTQSP